MIPNPDPIPPSSRARRDTYSALPTKPPASTSRSPLASFTLPVTRVIRRLIPVALHPSPAPQRALALAARSPHLPASPRISPIPFLPCQSALPRRPSHLPPSRSPPPAPLLRYPHGLRFGSVASSHHTPPSSSPPPPRVTPVSLPCSVFAGSLHQEEDRPRRRYVWIGHPFRIGRHHRGASGCAAPKWPV
jgi:hypothetical protein